jgi:hypothetical protein
MRRTFERLARRLIDGHQHERWMRADECSVGLIVGFATLPATLGRRCSTARQGSGSAVGSSGGVWARRWITAMESRTIVNRQLLC